LFSFSVFLTLGQFETIEQALTLAHGIWTSLFKYLHKPSKAVAGNAQIKIVKATINERPKSCVLSPISSEWNIAPKTTGKRTKSVQVADAQPHGGDQEQVHTTDDEEIDVHMFRMGR